MATMMPSDIEEFETKRGYGVRLEKLRFGFIRKKVGPLQMRLPANLQPYLIKNLKTDWNRLQFPFKVLDIASRKCNTMYDF
jgi:hypothetical protein